MFFDIYSPYGQKNSPEYLEGFNDGYKVARQEMQDLIENMKPFRTSTCTATAGVEV